MNKIKLDLEKLIQTYNQSRSIIRVAQAFGVSYGTAQSRLHEAGAKVHHHVLTRAQKKRELIPIDIAALAQRYREVRSIRIVAEEFGVSPNTVRRRLGKL